VRLERTSSPVGWKGTTGHGHETQTALCRVSQDMWVRYIVVTWGDRELIDGQLIPELATCGSNVACHTATVHVPYR